MDKNTNKAPIAIFRLNNSFRKITPKSIAITLLLVVRIVSSPALRVFIALKLKTVAPAHKKAESINLKVNPSRLGSTNLPNKSAKTNDIKPKANWKNIS